MKSFKRIKTEKTFVGRRVTIERVHYDQVHPMEHVVVKPASVILPVTKDNKIILISQVRTAVGDKKLYEVPAGLIDESDYLGSLSEDIDAAKRAAVRELEEETGYIANYDEVTFLSKAYTSPGFTNEEVYIFLADNLAEKRLQHLDESEDIQVHEVEVTKVMEMLKNNEFENISTITALLMYKDLL